MTRTPLPALIVTAWIALVGALLWAAAQSAVEPPVWDAMSYMKKGITFWQAMGRPLPFNPFDLEPTMRPPGVVLMAYPLGYSFEFQGFYFRSSFMPLLLLALAAVIADTRDGVRWSTAFVAIALISMPMLFQFQANDSVLWDVNWGMVDNFMAGVAGVSAAAAIRSIKRHSIVWGLIAAGSAAFCFLIKPSGLLVMALTGLGWFTLLLWSFRGQMQTLWTDKSLLWFTAASLTGALVIFGVTVYYAVASQYFSVSNILFGNRVLSILSSEITAGVSVGDFLDLVKISLGYVIAGLTIGGVALAFIRRETALGAISLVCLIAGTWFWFFETEPWEPRYFVPFGIMAFVFIAPVLTDALDALSLPLTRTAVAIVSLPGLAIIALLCVPAPPIPLQRALGVNLFTDLFKAETQQAQALLKLLQDAGVKRSSIYRYNITPPQRSFEAMLSYINFIDPSSPQVDILSPMDWQRPSAFRLEEMARAGFLVFEPVRDESERQRLLAQNAVTDFYAETLLFNAWTTTLGPEQGVELVSETQLRVLKVVNQQAFEAAFADFVGRHQWRDAFLQSNQARWWSAAELDTHLRAAGRALLDVSFDGAATLKVRGAIPTFKSTMLEVDVWVEGEATPAWVLFAHAVNDKGEILRNGQVNLVAHAGQDPARAIRRYTITYADLPPEVKSIALGFFLPGEKDMGFLHTNTQPSDWEGRRLYVPMTANKN